MLMLLLSLLVTTAGMAQRTIKIAGGKAPVGTERRAAIIIANQDYQQDMMDLKKVYNDADDMKEALDKLGFEILVFRKDLSRLALDRMLLNLATQLKGYQVAFFYYSGHGAEFQGKNYLLPTDMPPLEFRSDLATYGISLDRVYEALGQAGVRTSIVVSDACRSLPLGKGLPTGMVIPANNPAGTFTMFATRSGNLSLENAGGRNGYFTQELLKNLVRPNWTLDNIFYETRKGVKAATNNQQEPSVANELDDPFVFVIQDKGKEDTRAVDQPFGPAMVFVRGGTFPMGSNENDNEKPIHYVTVSDFMMGKYEVTVAEFEQFIEATRYLTDAEKEGHSYRWNGKEWEKWSGVNWRCDAEGKVRSPIESNHPVIHVSWNDADAYCLWLSRRTGKRYRLPTEAEWEYACGNGSAHTKYSWGNEDPSGTNGGNIADQSGRRKFNWSGIASNYDDGYATTAPVGSYTPNKLGLFDMSGNIWEWCQDWYGSYSGSSSVNPQGPGSGTNRVMRGGSWDSGSQYYLSTFRTGHKPAHRGCFVGFRVVSPVQ
ncbi:hypothetical protein GCM10023187_52940 [Nibrella viscosa]|uniref:Caspase family p20 domain-containing protein n=1 Tax=Nibrella viscosa TaxID=1084524 RepID=A0ABP8KY39_9BACT